MTDNESNSEGRSVVFDGWRSMTIALFLSLTGYGVMVSVPVLSTALVEKEGFTAVEVGMIWGRDLLGLAIGALTAGFLVAKVNRRHLVAGGILLAVGANALCLKFGNYEAMLWLRVFAGIGNGIFTAVAVTTLGGTTNPVRAFNILLFLFAFSTAVELRLFPKLSMNEIYCFFIVLPMICGLFLKWLPHRPLNAEELSMQEEDEDHIDNWHVPKFIPMVCLLAVCFTYINIGGYYTYIDLAANGAGVSDEFMADSWTYVSFLGLVGCVIAFFCTRFGLYKPLFAGLVAMTAVVAMPSAGINNTSIFISLFGFMTLWTFADVFQSAMISHMDRSGSFVAMMPAVQGFGQFVGPTMAASILASGYSYNTVFVVSSTMTLFAVILYIGIFFHTRKNNGASSDSTPTESYDRKLWIEDSR